MKFSRVITTDRSAVRAKGEKQSPKVKATEVKNFAPFWAFPDRNSSLNSQMAAKLRTKLEVV